MQADAASPPETCQTDVWFPIRSPRPHYPESIHRYAAKFPSGVPLPHSPRKVSLLPALPQTAGHLPLPEHIRSGLPSSWFLQPATDTAKLSIPEYGNCPYPPPSHNYNRYHRLSLRIHNHIRDSTLPDNYKEIWRKLLPASPAFSLDPDIVYAHYPAAIPSGHVHGQDSTDFPHGYRLLPHRHANVPDG